MKKLLIISTAVVALCCWGIGTARAASCPNSVKEAGEQCDTHDISQGQTECQEWWNQEHPNEPMPPEFVCHTPSACRCGWCGDGHFDTLHEDCGDDPNVTCPQGEICVNCKCVPELQLGTIGGIRVQIPRDCGNNAVDSGEQCDVGSLESTDPSYAAAVATQCNAASNSDQSLQSRMNRVGKTSFDGTEAKLRCISCICSWCGDSYLAQEDPNDPSLGPEECSETGLFYPDNTPILDQLFQQGGGGPLTGFPSPVTVDCPAGYTCEECGCKSDLLTYIPGTRIPFVRPTCGNKQFLPDHNDPDVLEECDITADGITFPGDQTNVEQQCVLSGVFPSPNGYLKCPDPGDPDQCNCIGCGDGILNTAAGEECEIEPDPITGQAYLCKGNMVCDMCNCETCGNGYIDAGEQCDFNYDLATDPQGLGDTWEKICPPNPNAVLVYCKSDCTCGYRESTVRPGCGNGNVDAGEWCDVGQDVTDPNDPLVATVAQQCIDSNTPTYGNVPHIPTRCVGCFCEWCGDGKRNGNEACDINESPINIGMHCNGGTCNPDCTCKMPPPPCGNQKWDSGEACDDSVLALPEAQRDPGWENMCKEEYEAQGVEIPAEPWRSCFGCECTVCGNGILEYPEYCEPSLWPQEKQCPPIELAGNWEYTSCENCTCVPERLDECVDGLVCTLDADCPEGQRCVLGCCEEVPAGCHVIDPQTGRYEVDPGEQCDGQTQVEAAQYCKDTLGQGQGEWQCLWNCQCFPIPRDEPPPVPLLVEEEPEIEQACVVRIAGCGGKDCDWLDDINKRVHKILGQDIDLVGEIGYSVAYVDIVFPNASAGKGYTLAKGIKSIALKSDATGGDYVMAPWAIIQDTGTPPTDYRQYTYIPVIKPVSEKVLLWPVPGAIKAQSVKATTLMPDLASVGDIGSVTLTDISTYLGSDATNFEVGTPTSMKLNNFISWEVYPSINLTQADSDAVGATYQKGSYRMPWGWPRWTGTEGFQLPEGMKEEDLYIENMQMDLNLVLEELERRKGDPRYKNACEMLHGLTYENYVNQGYTIAQNSLVADQGTYSQKVASIATFAEQARGTGCSCNMSAAAPSVSNFVLLFGMAATGLGSIIAVRRRRKK